jgi:hypothetical protein
MTSIFSSSTSPDFDLHSPFSVVTASVHLPQRRPSSRQVMSLARLSVSSFSSPPLLPFNNSTMPRTVQLDSATTVNVPGFGAMGLSQVYGKANDEQSKQTLRHAIEIVRFFLFPPSLSSFQRAHSLSILQGCTFWNSATIYGPEQHNEKLIGSVLREGDNRSKVFMTTKWGIKPDGLDGAS